MKLELTTPAILFPAVSLLLLAYTNRFLAIANLIRNLHKQFQDNPNHIIIGQIQHLRHRVILIRNMQAFGVSSLFLCVFCMFLIFAGEPMWAQYLFGVSLIFLLISLGLSIREIQLSTNALNLELSDMEESSGKL